MLPLLTPVAALAALLTVWAISLAFYLLKPRRRRVVVPFMPLWDALLLAQPTTRLFGRLRRVGSLLIAFAITGLLVIALTDPRPALIGRKPRRLLVLIDAGQHMQARDIAPSRLERARSLASQLVIGKAPDDEVLIAQMDASVTPLGPASADAARLQAALTRLVATDAATDFGAAAEYALQNLTGRPNPSLVLITDGAFEVDPRSLEALRRQHIDVRQLRLGKSTRNVGIRSFSARRYSWDKAHSELMLELENAGSRTELLEVSLLGDDTALAVAKLELAPHTLTTRFYSDVSGRAQRLEARIALQAGSDPLAADDRAYALMPPQTATRVLLVTNGNRYLEAALLLDTSHAVSVISPEQYRDAIGYDVVVFDRYAPETPPGVPSLFIAAPANPRDFPLRVLGSVERPRVEQTLHDHPLLRQVALRDVNIAKAGRLVLQAGDRAIAGAKTTPLIVTGIRAEQAFVAIGFDVRESDLPLRVAWPVLLTHVLDFLHPPDVEYLPALEVGIQQLVPVAETESHISVRTPLGTRESLAMEPSGRGVWLRPLQAGFYRLESQAETRVRAANRQALRSVSIAPQPLRGVRTTRPAGAHSPWNSEAWVLLLGLAWLVAFVEWLTYQRRWTV